MTKGLESMSLAPGKVPKHPLENAWTLWFFKVNTLRIILNRTIWLEYMAIGYVYYAYSAK